MSQEIERKFLVSGDYKSQALIRAASFRDISVVPVEERFAYAYVMEKAI